VVHRFTLEEIMDLSPDLKTIGNTFIHNNIVCYKWSDGEIIKVMNCSILIKFLIIKLK
jgi:hypothetical protein